MSSHRPNSSPPRDRTNNFQQRARQQPPDGRPRDPRLGMRPNAPGRGHRGPASGSGTRPTTTYHQQQQDHAREVRQRKLLRQQEGRHNLQQQHHQQQQQPHNNNRLRYHPSDGHRPGPQQQQQHRPPPQRQLHPPPANYRRQQPGDRSFHNNNNNGRPNNGYQYRPTPSRPPPQQHRPAANPKNNNINGAARRGPPQQPPGRRITNNNNNPRSRPANVIDLLSDSSDEEEPAPAPAPVHKHPTQIVHSASDSRSLSSLSHSQATVASKRKSAEKKSKDNNHRSPMDNRKKPPPESQQQQSTAASKSATKRSTQQKNQMSGRPAAATAKARQETSPSQTVIALSSSDESSSDDSDEDLPLKKITSKSKTNSKQQSATPELSNDHSKQHKVSDPESTIKGNATNKHKVASRPIRNNNTFDDDDSSDSDDDEESEREDIVQFEDSSDDEDDDNLPEAPKITARKSAPVRQNKKSRIDSDSSESEESEEDSSSGSESDSESDSDEGSSVGSSDSWYSLKRFNSRDDDQDDIRKRFGQKTAADSALREKHAARKTVSGRKAPPPQSSQSTTSASDDEEEMLEVVISDDTSSGEEEISEPEAVAQRGSSSGTFRAEQVPREESRQDTAPQSITNIEPTNRKRKLDVEEEKPPSTPNVAYKRRQGSSDSDNEFFKGDASSSSELVVNPTALKSPSPLVQRRCRSTPVRFRDEYRSPIDSPHATTGRRDDDENEVYMVVVDHLTKVNVNPETGLPVMAMTCHAEDAEILYDFRVDVGTSGIPNSGNGAFLTFLGARHLKDEAFGKSPPKLAQQPLVLDDSLQAVSELGFGIHVKVTGESIDPRRAQRPTGIGPKCAFVETDYEPSPTTVFSSKGKGNGLIQLGRYGPFRTMDRKPVCEFDVKSFILGYEPSEWCFGVEENLFDREGGDQIIDITDDLTGRPHDLAQKNIPMYVNEVGHNKDLIHNVESRTVDDRAIHYYINIERPMKKGEKVELLTDYFDFYEDVRLRKGYGKANLEEGVKSDEDAKARYERNVDLRVIIVQRVRDLDLFKTYQMIEFVEETMHQPLRELVDRFLEAHQANNECDLPVPLARQFVALIRLQYFGGIALTHAEDLEKKFEKERFLEAGYPWPGMVRQCKLWALGMKRTPLSTLWQLSENVKDSEGKSILLALRSEILEMRWFDMRKDLRSPFDAGIWCPIALALTDDLSWEVSTPADSIQEESLLERIYGFATQAADAIRTEAKVPISNSSVLSFASGITSDSAFVSAQKVAELRDSSFDGHSMNPKGLLAASLDILAYMDCNFLLDDHAMERAFSLPVEQNKRYAMTKFDGFRNGSPLTSLPKSAGDCEKLSAVINVQWYLVWQVVLVANAFATTFLPADSSFSEAYSLQELCRRVGVDYSLSKAAIAQGIRRQKSQPHIKKAPKTKKTTNKAKKSAGALKAKSPRLKSVEISCGPPDEPLEGGWPAGWTKKVYERQSGASKGHRDRYWYTPQHSYKLRSMSDVKKFLACLKTVGNEELAWKFFKGKVSGN